MSLGRSRIGGVTASGFSEWVAVCLRAVVVAMVSPAAAMKLLDYEAQAAFFADIGVPAPDQMVVIVAGVQFLAVGALLVGVATRFAALVLVAVMVAAMALHAVVASNVTVLLASAALAALGPGKYARWDPERTVLDRTGRVETGDA